MLLDVTEDGDALADVGLTNVLSVELAINVEPLTDVVVVVVVGCGSGGCVVVVVVVVVVVGGLIYSEINAKY